MLRLLIAGPDDLSLELSATALWRPDVERVHVRTFDAVIEVAAECHPNLVVLDGANLEATLSLVKALRTDPRSRPTAIVVLVRGLPAESEDLLLAAGANAVLPTPVDAFVWDRRLEELLFVPCRLAQRIPIQFRDWSGVVREGMDTGGEVINMGPRGVLLETPAPLELGAKVGLSFRLPGDTTDLHVVGQVVRQGGEWEGGWRSGIEFLVYRGDARERIGLFVEADAPLARPGAPATAGPLRLHAFDMAREWEEELRVSELRKTLILDSALDCIITVDHQARVLEFNASARRLFGYTRNQVFGRDVADKIVRPGDREAFRRLLGEFVEKGDTDFLGRRRDAMAMRADGLEFPVEVAVFPAWIRGKVLLTAFIRDLTERKRLERLSAMRNACTRVLADAAAPADASPRLCEIVARETGARAVRLWLLERDPAELRAAASWPAGSEPLGSKGEIPAAAEVVGPTLRVPIQAASRRLGVVEVETAVPLDREWPIALEELGSQIGLFVERHQAEHALLDSQANIAAVANAIPGAVFQYETRPNGDDQFTFMSRGGKELLEVDFDALREEGPVRWHPMVPASVEPLRHSALAAAPAEWEATFKATTASGVKWIRGHAAPTALAKGAIVWNGIFVDVTARTSAEERLLSVNADLDRRLADLRRAETELQRLARFDSLTGLPNRSFFLESLTQTLLRAHRHKTRLALVFVDVDGFKAVNDSLGHAAGDVLLRTVADRLRTCTRKSDVVARIGGDEFTVLLHDLGRADDAAYVAQGVLDQLSEPYRLAEREVTITASVGISVHPDDGEDGGTLLQNADLAMYRAKQEGKNTFRFFTSSMSERARERMLMLGSLRRSLEAGEFELYYQPLVHDAAPPSLEALIRWRHPDKGLVAPDEFIGAAEESGLILPIGTWALQTATKFARSLQRTDVCVAVNLSARQFLQPDLLKTVESALAEADLPPTRLELEVTESAVMSDAEEVRERLDTLRAMGVRLALDDFGSGYSSLGYLKRFRFHRLKIDRSFVRDLPEDGDSQAIVDAILAMAKALGLEVVAEGVENEKQLAFLRARGCHGFQGYYFSYPLPGADVPAYLDAASR